MTAQKRQPGDEPTDAAQSPLGTPGSDDAQPVPAQEGPRPVDAARAAETFEAADDDGSGSHPAEGDDKTGADARSGEAAVEPAADAESTGGSAGAEPAAESNPGATGPDVLLEVSDEPGLAVVRPEDLFLPAAQAGSEPAPAATQNTSAAATPPAASTGSGEPAAVAPAEPEAAAALTAERLLEPRNRPPVGGWRRWLYTATLGKVNVGDSDAVRLRRIREHRIAAPLGEGTRYVPVLSRKGGVGKTTVTTLLGMALAQVREDRVIALDANPDRGTLTDRSPGRARYTARQLVQNRFMVDSFSKLSAYAAREGSRLHVLASDTDPHVAEAFDDADYRAVTDLLSKFYSIVLTDSGTGMVHSVMNGTLEKANTAVLVSGASVDEARLASETLSWLEAHGRGDLAKQAIVVINQSAGPGGGASIEEIEAHFLTRAATVVRLPHDPHLAEGARIELERLRPATREAVMELASHVVENLRS